MDVLKLYEKYNNDLKDLLSPEKKFSDDIGMWFILEKCAKITFKKGLLVMSKNIILDINTEITKFEYNKTNKWLEINEVNGINHTTNKKNEKRIL